jgi:hypothetical protein
MIRTLLRLFTPQRETIRTGLVAERLSPGADLGSLMVVMMMVVMVVRCSEHWRGKHHQEQGGSK